MAQGIQLFFYLFGMSKLLLFVFQRFLFALLQFSLIELRILESQKILFFPALLVGFFQAGLFPQQLFPTVVGSPIVCQTTGIASQYIYDPQLKTAIAQQQVLMLRMDIDQPFAQFFKQSDRYGCVVDESP